MGFIHFSFVPNSIKIPAVVLKNKLYFLYQQQHTPFRFGSVKNPFFLAEGSCELLGSLTVRP